MPTIPFDRVVSPGPAAATGDQRGRSLVVGLVLLGLAAAVAAILFQRQQTRRCLDFYGADHARRIAAAPVVELLLLEPGTSPTAVAVRTRRDVSKAAGLVHLRRGLVEDANFTWDGGRVGGGSAAAVRTSADAVLVPDAAGRLPHDAWDIALEFSEPAGSATSAAGTPVGRTQLVFDVGPGQGAVAVVGRPGRIGLGRLGPGLEKWIRGLAHEAADPSRP